MNLPVIQDPLLVSVDLQERLLPAVHGREELTARVGILLQGAAALGVRMIATEQYPRGLGSTLPELAALFAPGTPAVAKTSFSVFGESAFRGELAKCRPHALIFCGVEAHVCVLQSIFDAIEEGFPVIVAADAVSSRKSADVAPALEAARQAGAWVLGTESILFMLLKDSRNPAFKTVSRLIK